MYLCRSLSGVRDITRRWIKEYNEERPQDPLEDLTPLGYLAAKSKLENSNYAWT